GDAAAGRGRTGMTRWRAWQASPATPRVGAVIGHVDIDAREEITDRVVHCAALLVRRPGAPPCPDTGGTRTRRARSVALRDHGAPEVAAPARSRAAAGLPERRAARTADAVERRRYREDDSTRRFPARRALVPTERRRDPTDLQVERDSRVDRAGEQSR